MRRWCVGGVSVTRLHPVEPELAALLSLGNYLRARRTGPSDLGRLCQVAYFFAAAADK